MVPHLRNMVKYKFFVVKTGGAAGMFVTVTTNVRIWFQKKRIPFLEVNVTEIYNKTVETNVIGDIMPDGCPTQIYV